MGRTHAPRREYGRDKVLATNRDAEDKLHGLAGRPATSGRRMLARTRIVLCTLNPRTMYHLSD